MYENLINYDPLKDITVGSSSTGSGVWSQINSTLPYDPIPSISPTLSELLNRLNKLELDNKCLRLKVLGLEGKFTKEEVSNIRKMLMSEDEASRTLADSIIENV
jgi:hypothetical protein